CRKVQDARSVLVLVRLQLLVVHRPVGGAKIHRAFGHLLDPASRSNGLIVDLNVGILLVVLVEPFGINGVRERGTCAIDRERALRPESPAEGEDDHQQTSDSLHRILRILRQNLRGLSRGMSVCGGRVTGMLQKVQSWLNAGSYWKRA